MSTASNSVQTRSNANPSPAASNPFMDAMMAGGAGGGGAPGGMDMSALMGMMGGGNGGGGGGMDIGALMGMMGGSGAAGGGGAGAHGGMDIGALMGMMGGGGGGGNGSGAGGGASPSGGGQMDMITKIMPYIPKILAFATKVPSFICGYCIGLAVLLFVHFLDPISLVVNQSPTASNNALLSSNTATATLHNDGEIIFDSDDMVGGSMGGESQEGVGLFTDDIGTAAFVNTISTGFTYLAPQAGFFLVFLALVALSLPIFRRAKAIVEGAKYEVARADDIAKEAKRKVAMKEHNAELD